MTTTATTISGGNVRAEDAVALHTAVQLLERRLREQSAGGVRGADLIVLAAVAELADCAYPTALGDHLGMRRSNVSAKLRDLDRRGFVMYRRTVGGTDGRRRPVTLTERGFRALAARQTENERWLTAQGAAHLTAEEVDILRHGIPLIRRLASS